MKRYVTVLLILLPASLLASCLPMSNISPIRNTEVMSTSTPPSLLSPQAGGARGGPTATPAPMVAFTSGRYRNLFREMLNKSEADIQTKLDAAWKQLFYGNDDTQRVYYPVAALAATTDKAPQFVEALWDAPIPSGKWRYYDGLLYMLALLHVNGSFRIYAPK